MTHHTLLKYTVIIAAIVLLYYMQSKEEESHIKSLKWPQVTARVHKTHIAESGTSPSDEDFIWVTYKPIISVRYKFDGKTHSTVLQSDTFYDSDEANRFVEDYPVGHEVHLFVNPEDPSQCQSQKNSKSSSIWWYIMVMVMLVGLVLLADDLIQL